MLSARSVKKFLVLPLLLSAITFVSAEARRDYQTIEKQDLTQVSDAKEDPIGTITATKHSAQLKQTKPAHQTPIAVIFPKKEQSVSSAPANQFLSSPLDCMIQYEKENHAGLERQPALISEQFTAELTAPSNSKILTTNQSSGLPIDVAVTAIAFGICCYSFARKFLFRRRTTSIAMVHESQN